MGTGFLGTHTLPVADISSESFEVDLRRSLDCPPMLLAFDFVFPVAFLVRWRFDLANV